MANDSLQTTGTASRWGTTLGFISAGSLLHGVLSRRAVCWPSAALATTGLDATRGFNTDS